MSMWKQIIGFVGLTCIGVTCMYSQEMKKEEQKPLMVVLIGAPGSGKGTQAETLVKKFGIVHISTGDMLRDNIKKETPIGVKAKSFIEAGALVPDTVVIDMLQERIRMPDCKAGVLLDGFPRTLAQAEACRQIQSAYTVVVISLEISDAEVLSRITGRRCCPTCNKLYHVSFAPPKTANICDKCSTSLIIRKDDVEATVKERLAIFHTQSGPIKAFYAAQKSLFEIRSDQQSAVVGQQCIAAIESVLKK